MTALSTGQRSPAQAMILAAGRGERMRPLTDHTPKPLLQVQGKPLLQWHLENMAAAGIDRVVMNTGWLGEQVAHYWGDAFTPTGSAHSVSLQYSREDVDFGQGIETAGGIARALPLLEPVFWLVAGDAYMPDFAFDEQQRRAFAQSGMLAHLWLVPNPEHHPKGDFARLPNGQVVDAPDAARLGLSCETYSTLALLHQDLFALPWCDIAPGNPQGVHAKLAPLLRQAMQAGKVTASLYEHQWVDVGTPERLARLNETA